MVSLRDFIRISYKEDAVLDWKLRAKESYIFPSENRTIIYEIDFEQYEKGTLQSRIIGKRGEINHSTKSVALEGRVDLVTYDGKRLQTENLNYDLENKTLKTDAEVIITSEGTTIRGKGLRGDRELNKFTILKPLAVTRGGTSPLKNK